MAKPETLNFCEYEGSNPVIIAKKTNMKKILTFIILTFISCTNELSNDVDRYISESHGLILKKSTTSLRYGIIHYGLYIYDGEQSNWFSCDQSLYSKYKEGDSIDVFIVKETYHSKDVNNNGIYQSWHPGMPDPDPSSDSVYKVK